MAPLFVVCTAVNPNAVSSRKLLTNLAHIMDHGLAQPPYNSSTVIEFPIANVENEKIKLFARESL